MMYSYDIYKESQYSWLFQTIACKHAFEKGEEAGTNLLLVQCKLRHLVEFGLKTRGGSEVLICHMRLRVRTSEVLSP